MRIYSRVTPSGRKTVSTMDTKRHRNGVETKLATLAKSIKKCRFVWISGPHFTLGAKTNLAKGQSDGMLYSINITLN